jgi:hypothetical protein
MSHYTALQIAFSRGFLKFFLCTRCVPINQSCALSLSLPNFHRFIYLTQNLLAKTQQRLAKNLANTYLEPISIVAVAYAMENKSHKKCLPS